MRTCLLYDILKQMGINWPKWKSKKFDKSPYFQDIDVFFIHTKLSYQF